MKREGFLRAALVGVAALCGLGVAKKAAVLSDPTPHVRNTMPVGGNRTRDLPHGENLVFYGTPIIDDTLFVSTPFPQISCTHV